MKKILLIIPLIIWSATSVAQVSRFPQRLELTQIEINDGELTLEVFNMPSEGQAHYYLSVGRLGLGDEVIQVNIDPVSELFIPLGDTLSDAMDKLKELQAMYKTSPGTSTEVTGCVAVGFPNDKLEPVKVTYRKVLLSNMLEFSVERQGYIRSAHVSKSDFGSLVTSMKMYRKIHPKEK